MRNWGFTIFLLLLILTACSQDKIYEKHIKFESYSWNRFKDVLFEVPIEDIKCNYNFYFAIKHTTQYPYKSLRINFTIYTPSGEFRTMDYALNLKDNKGNFFGKTTVDTCYISILLRKDFLFSKKGICKFEIGNLMPKIETQGIMEIGLIVERSD
jgi:gliding motility-associated lipoprotein GldH